MTDDQQRFATRAIRRKRLFLGLSIAGIVVAVALAGYYAWRWWGDANFPVGTRIALVVLILLNARQNLRQYKLATILEQTEATVVPVD